MESTSELSDINEFTFSEKDLHPHSDTTVFYLKHNSNKAFSAGVPLASRE